MKPVQMWIVVGSKLADKTYNGLIFLKKPSPELFGSMLPPIHVIEVTPDTVLPSTEIPAEMKDQ